ncbi:hypothetical protein V5799_020373 [Amblyomma americanum]|uniref:EGF-like domain-containing protein n=1 Tax=Amblyomma americanum TaxID=6943 RepID=A0AAQ4EUJ5_AMBAM
MSKMERNCAAKQYCRRASCEYDYVEIDEPDEGHSSGRLCGDWSGRVKLLRQYSHGRRLRVQFTSDFSHAFKGFKAEAVLRPALPRDLNSTRTEPSGTLTSLHHPAHYLNDLHYSVSIVGPPGSRVLLSFSRLDLEWQADCLYDYIEIQSPHGQADPVRICGQHETDLDRYVIKSETPSLPVLVTLEDLEVGVRDPSGHCLGDRVSVRLSATTAHGSPTTVILCGGEQSVPRGYQLLSYGDTLKLTLEAQQHRTRRHRGFNITFRAHPLYLDKTVTLLADVSLDSCTPNPCLNGGSCIEDVTSKKRLCSCTPPFAGPRCEKQLFRLPYRPLSQRMLEEPFWLGLITVSAVLLLILLVYCIKRKFADKIEKFLAEEIERSKNS